MEGQEGSRQEWRDSNLKNNKFHIQKVEFNNKKTSLPG
jgi:hypothetical protein